jgi:hypothetical protein
MALWHSKRKAFRCGHRGLHTPSIRQSVARICDMLHSWVIGQCRVGRVFRRLSGLAGATCARTPTYRSCDQVRVRHQLGNGEGARHRSSAGASCHRRRGDRVGDCACRFTQPLASMGCAIGLHFRPCCDAQSPSGRGQSLLIGPKRHVRFGRKRP